MIGLAEQLAGAVPWSAGIAAHRRVLPGCVVLAAVPLRHLDQMDCHGNPWKSRARCVSAAVLHGSHLLAHEAAPPLPGR